MKREDFPDAGEDAVWAVDLVGCEVVNREGVTLGQIEGIGTNGVQDIFSIGWERPDGKRASFLIRTSLRSTSSKSTSTPSASRSTGIPSGAEGDGHAF